MKLYELAITPSCRRVDIFLKELGVEIERETVNVREGENLTSAFKQISSNGKVPVLELDDGRHLCESVAICRYIDSISPNDKSLFGQTAFEQAQVEMWHRIVEWQGLIPLFQAVRNLTQVYKDRENCVPEWGEESKRRLVDFLPQVDQRLSESHYLALGSLTIVDISAYVMIIFADQVLKLAVRENYSNIAAWLARLETRPSFQ
ncbi:glutathione S-transferase [Vibrio sp. PP-XX7]